MTLPPASGPRTVLVVDDDSLTRMMIVSVLEDAGYPVAQAASAAEALERVAAQADIALVLSDVVMPGAMDGLALARHLRQAHAHVAVVLVSGLPVSEAEQEGIGFLSKPFAMREVIALAKLIVGPAG